MTVKYIVGSEDYLFLDNDHNGVIAQTTGALALPADAIDRIYGTHRAVFCGLKSFGCKYIHVVAPNKETSLRKFLPDGVNYEEFGLTPVRKYMEVRPDTKEFTFFDPDLISLKPGELATYSRGDTHWTTHGARKYIQEAFAAFNLFDYIDRLGELRFVEECHSVIGDLALHAGRAEEEIIDLELTAKSSNLNFEGSIVNEGYVRHYSRTDRGERALVIHDSFAHAAFDFLGELFGETLFIHCPDHLPEVVECFRPDIVIRLQAERFFPREPKILPSVVDWVIGEEMRKETDKRTSTYLARYSKRL